MITGNEQMVVEAKPCKKKIKPELPGLDCLPNICESACQREHTQAKGICEFEIYCYCYYPC